MIALLLALTAAKAAPPPATDDEITVTARRAREFRYRIGFDRTSKRLACKILRSTGDKPLDELLCQTAQSRVPAGTDPRPKPTDARLTRMRTCLNSGENAAIATRAARLHAARPKS